MEMIRKQAERLLIQMRTAQSHSGTTVWVNTFWHASLATKSELQAILQVLHFFWVLHTSVLEV